MIVWCSVEIPRRPIPLCECCFAEREDNGEHVRPFEDDEPIDSCFDCGELAA